MDQLCLRGAPFDRTALEARLRTRGVQPGAHGARYGARGAGPSPYLADPEGNPVR